MPPSLFWTASSGWPREGRRSSGSKRAVKVDQANNSKRDGGKFQRMEPVSSGMRIAPSFNLSLIQSRNDCFVPCTNTGEQPRPTSGRIDFLRLSWSINHGAHSGTTGKPKRRATRFKTKRDSPLHRTLRIPSRSAPGLVFTISSERATRWRSGRFRPGTATLPRKHFALGPRVATTLRPRGICSLKTAPSMTAADNRDQMGSRSWILAWLQNETTIWTRTSLIVSFTRLVNSRRPKRS